MNTGKTLFAQLMEFVPWTSFSRIVARYAGDARSMVLPCSEHFRIMAYAQITWRESLRDIEATLGANPTKLYGMGLRQAVRRPPRLPMPTSGATGTSGATWPRC